MKRLLFVFLGLFSVYGSAKSVSLFQYDWRNGSALAVFQQSSGQSEAITKTHVYYLTREDCAEGLIADYVTPADTRPFGLIPTRTFAVNNQTIFSIGEDKLHDQIITIRGILLRFEGDKRTVSQFFGTCVDAGINCCIPVYCSKITHRCKPRYPMEVQSFEL